MATVMDPDERPMDDDLQSSELDPDDAATRYDDFDDEDTEDDDAWLSQHARTLTECAQDLETLRLASQSTDGGDSYTDTLVPSSDRPSSGRGAGKRAAAGAAGGGVRPQKKPAPAPAAERDMTITMEERGRRMFGRRGIVYRVSRLEELRAAAQGYFCYIAAGRRGYSDAVDVCRQSVMQLMEFYVMPRCASTHPEHNMVYLMRAATLEIANVEPPMRGDRCMITRKPLLGPGGAIHGGRLDAFKPTPGNRPRHKVFKLHGTIMSWFFAMRTLMNWDKFVIDHFAEPEPSQDHVAATFVKCFCDVAFGIGAALTNDEIKTETV